MPNLSARPRAIFNLIQSNLGDRYRSGFPVLKELIQNAEDAGASTIRFMAGNGWPHAHNPLLRVPGVLVVNDGDFQQEDADSMLSFGLSDKAVNPESIGRFGYGQKAVFHLCDAFVVHAIGHQVKFTTVINPCLGVIPNSKADSWDTIGESDARLLQAAAHPLQRGLLLWIPLRRDEILPAPKLSFREARPKIEEIVGELLQQQANLGFVLAGLRNLDTIEVISGGNLCFSLERTAGSTKMLGPTRAKEVKVHPFKGTIVASTGLTLSYVGREMAPEVGSLNNLMASNEWPREPVPTDDGLETQRKKAASHGAVMLGTWIARDGSVSSGRTIEWSVFLPVSQAEQFPPATRSSKISLHGYFFVDSGRRYIEGFDSDDEVTLGSQWNALLRDEVVLPLVPYVMFDALRADALSSDDLATLVADIRASEFGRTHLEKLTSRKGLVLTPDDTGQNGSPQWQLVRPGKAMRPVPLPGTNGLRWGDFNSRIFRGLGRWATSTNLTLVCGVEASLIPGDVAWSHSEIADVLELLEPATFLNTALAMGLADFLDRALAGRRLSPESTTVLLRKYRMAVVKDSSLASEEAMRRVWAFLPARSVVSVPVAAGERFVLRALAAADGGPAALRESWLTPGTAVEGLETRESLPLLKALQPILEIDAQADAAGAAALTIVKLAVTQSPRTLEDQSLTSLRCLRAFDGSASSEFVSMQELMAASREKRLFRETPDVRGAVKALRSAAPGTGALYVTSSAKQLLDEMRDHFQVADGSKVELAALVQHATHFGASVDRARLLALLYTPDHEARNGLRALAAGDLRAANPNVTLIALRGTVTRLDELALRLLADSDTEFLVDAEIAANLTLKNRVALGISEWDEVALGKLLANNADRLPELGIDEDTVSELLASAVPDSDVRRLPVFWDTNGTLRRASEVWQVTPEWPVPHSMEHLVPQLRSFASQSAQERAEGLVAQWTPIAQVKLALAQPAAHSFSTEILSALVQVPDVNVVGTVHSSWITDVKGRQWGLQDVMNLPESVERALRVSLPKSGLRAVPISEVAVSIREHAGFKRLLESGTILSGRPAVDRLLEELRTLRPSGYMGEAVGEALGALVHLARSGATLGLPAWQLLSALLVLPDQNTSVAFSAFEGIRSGQVQAAIGYMNSLADLAEAGQVHAWTAYISAFKTLCEWPEPVRQEVMGAIRVRTESGAFRLGSEVAGHGHGLAASHQLTKVLRQLLPWEPAVIPPVGPLDSGTQMQEGHQPDAQELEQEVVDWIQHVIRYAAPHVPHSLLALLVGLLGRSKRFLNLARNELLDLPVEEIYKVWQHLEEKVESACSPNGATTVAERRGANFILLRPTSVNPETIELETLAGSVESIPTGDIAPLELIGYLHGSGYNYWLENRVIRTISLRIALPQQATVDTEHVKKFCLLLAEVIIGHPHAQRSSFDALRQLADDLALPDQATVESVQDEIRDQLPRVLRELRPELGGALASALERYQTTVDAQLPGAATIGARQRAKLELWNQVDRSIAHEELLSVIRRKIASYGYDPNRILFELFQNADDAYVQHPIDGDARFLLRRGENSSVLRVLHWGRLVNHLGPDPEEGKRQGWQRDLFNMLQLNLSEKRGDETGRFGLGFKSVHLISKDVGVASRFVTCRIRGGMLPEVWEEGRQLSVSNTYAGRAATVVELVADSDRLPEVGASVSAFLKAVKWLPAMSQAIRTVEINGAGTWKVEVSPTRFNDVRILSFSGSGSSKAVDLRLADQASLFFELDSDGPTAAEGEVPRLWQLAPLEETLKSGWLINSATFRVDPGRGQLAGTAEDKRSWFTVAGEALGVRLVELYDWITDDWSGAAEFMGLVDLDKNSGREQFLERLFELFALDLTDDLAKQLHGANRGFGRLISNRAALPTELPQPFARLIKVEDVQHVLYGSLANPALLSGVSDWNAFESICATSVSERIASCLDELGFGKPSRFGLEQLLRAEIGSDLRLDPALAGRLGQLVAGRQFQTLTPTEQDAVHALLRQSQFLMEDGNWRTAAALPPRTAAGSGQGDLGLIMGFAPQNEVGSAEYEGKGLELYELAVEQSGYQRTARKFSEWAHAMTDFERQRALLRYVAEGSQGAELAKQFEKSWVPWIPETSPEMRVSPLVEGLEEPVLVTLLSRLYPQENLERWATTFWTEDSSEAPNAVRHSDFKNWLSETLAWWESCANGERNRYDAAAYPRMFSWDRLRHNGSEDDPEAWFTFFALGVFRTIGRTTDAAHRNFIDDAHASGWWSEMANADLPSDPQPWIDRLEDIAGSNALWIDYPQWRKGLTDLYVVARWLPAYSDVFRNLPRLAQEQGNFLLSDALRPSASPLWQRRGLEGAPLTQSLGFGANWMVREAIRHSFWSPSESSAMYRYAWAATSRVRGLLESFGIALGTEGPQMDLSPELYELVRDALGDEAEMLGDLDLPLQLRAGDSG